MERTFHRPLWESRISLVKNTQEMLLSAANQKCRWPVANDSILCDPPCYHCIICIDRDHRAHSCNLRLFEVCLCWMWYQAIHLRGCTDSVCRSCSGRCQLWDRQSCRFEQHILTIANTARSDSVLKIKCISSSEVGTGSHS